MQIEVMQDLHENMQSMPISNFVPILLKIKILPQLWSPFV